MSELKASAKPFDISKQEVWDAWVKVRGNKGSSGGGRTDPVGRGHVLAETGYRVHLDKPETSGSCPADR